MKILNRVTVTGADDSINPEQLLEVQRKYPYAEFGILMSKDRFGSVRFPSKKWLKKLSEINRELEPHLNLSGHICGRWVEDALLGQWPDLDRVSEGFASNFQRFQLNTHAQPHRYSESFFKQLERLNDNCQSVIFQLDGKDGNKLASAAIQWSKTNNIFGLFDLSHGAGLLPTEWPEPIPHLVCGYAGGLSPENVTSQLSIIEKATKGPTWIDAETRLFSGGGKQFDLKLVEAFLEAAKPWIII